MCWILMFCFTLMPPEELDTPVLQKQCGVAFQLFTSLLLVRRGWFANPALHLTAGSRPGWQSYRIARRSLSFGRSIFQRK